MASGTTLAIVVSVVLFAQFASPTGMPAAMIGVELSTLHRHTEHGAAESGAANWTTLYARLRERASRLPTIRQHAAISQLLTSLVDVEQGHRDARDAMREATEWVEQVDPENLAAKLAHAVLMLSAELAVEPAAAPTAKFDRLRQTLTEPRGGWKPALHDRDLTDAWFEILSEQLRRKDVAAAATHYYDHFEIRSHYAALPIIQRELGQLADSLDAENLMDEARQCRRWFVQLALGLMRSETDAGTRLLCADLLARMSGIDSDAEQAMTEFRRDFHAAAESAPIDLTDPMRSPSVRPREYQSAVRSMVFAAALGLSGAGCAILVWLALLVGALRSLTSNRFPAHAGTPLPQRSAQRRTVPVFVWIVLFAVALPLVLLLYQFEAHGIYSEYWLYVVAVAFMTACGHLILVVDRIFNRPQQPTTKPDAERQSRAGLPVTVALALLPLAILLLPPNRVAWLIRWFDAFMTGPLAMFALLVIVLFAAILSSRLPLRRVATIAMATWCLSAALGLISLQYHRVQAGERYQQAVAAGRMDEVAARLGNDWQQRYLKPVTIAYDMGTP